MECENIFMIKKINGTEHYKVSGGDGKYYINQNGDVYSMRTNDYLRRDGNLIYMSINGTYKRYNCKDILIMTLIDITDELRKQNSGLCDMLMHYYK